VITLRRPVLKRCPFKDESDAGELVIVLPGDAPELHTLGDQVDDLCADPITHEDFTRALLELLPEGAHVTTTWHTGSWSVEVAEGVSDRARLLRESEHAGGAAGHA
jgi:hypothetical protein